MDYKVFIPVLISFVLSVILGPSCDTCTQKT